MKQTSPYYVIGIGLSAGGLPALKELLAQLTPSIGAALVVILHLPSGYESSLPLLLGTHVGTEVGWIQAGVVPQPEGIYILPPGYQISFQGEAFQLLPRQPEEKINRMIDQGFQALATAFDNRSIGIILSGTGQDGLAGVKAIEYQRGVVIVQHPDTAQSDGMPTAM